MNTSYKMRTVGVFSFFLLLYLVILANLFWIQIWHAHFFKHLGIQQYQVTIARTPTRAPILDRNGRFFAMNKDCLSAFIMPSQLKEKDKVESFLQKAFPAAYARLERHQNKSFMYIKRSLNEEEHATIIEANLKDIAFLHETRRYYPIDSAGPIIGRTDVDNQGLFGIELLYNKTVAGSPTLLSLEKDARSGYFYFKKETLQEGVAGSPITLTLDANLQFLVAEELNKSVETLKAKEAAALIMNPHNGELLAMVNIPYFNPNDTNDISLYETKSRILTDSFELGSVFKIFTALAALEEGVVTLDEPIDCKESKSAVIDGRTINTVTAHGILPFIDVVARSNNIGIAQIAKRLGTTLYDHLKRLGFGTKTGINFPGETAGFVHHPRTWSKQSVFSLSYGYEVRATLLQLACAFALIANNGHPVTPRLVKNEGEEEKKPALYKPESINAVREILLRTAERGTGRLSAIKGYTVMCKTGTTNMLVNGRYCNDKNTFNCAGIVEKEDYQRVIVVSVKEIETNKDKQLYAQQVAAPLFERVARAMLIHDRMV